MRDCAEVKTRSYPSVRGHRLRSVDPKFALFSPFGPSEFILFYCIVRINYGIAITILHGRNYGKKTAHQTMWHSGRNLARPDSEIGVVLVRRQLGFLEMMPKKAKGNSVKTNLWRVR